MNQKDIKEYEGKKVKILLKNQFIYTCLLERVNKESIDILDKFDTRLTISNDSIAVLSPMIMEVN